MRSEEEEGLSVSLHGEQGNVCKLSYHRCHYPAASAIVAKLTQVDALPCAEVQTAVGDGDAEADSRETAFGMSRHVVVALEGVVIIRFALAHEVVVYGLHVVTHIGVGILVDAEGATGVLDEEVQQSGFGKRVGQVACHLFGYQMKAPCAGLQGKFSLGYHAVGLYFQIEIVLLLKPNGCGFAMSGIDKGGIGQGEEFFADAAEQCLYVSSGQVCASDASLEKYIASEETTSFGRVEDDASE